MAGESKKFLGAEFVMESSGASLSDGSFATCADVTFIEADVDGFPMATFEFDLAAGGFSAAPTLGARILLYEQRFNSDGNQGPTVDANFRHHLIGEFRVDLADTQQYMSIDAPIHFFGADFAVEWLDGGSGTASIDSGWILRHTIWTYQPVA